MFELHVTDTNVSTGSVAVGWCVSKETLALLHEMGNKTPQVVLIMSPADDAYHSSKQEVRKVVPLKDLVAYLEFERSGKMNIRGFIDARPKAKDVKDFWLDSTYNGFYYDTLTPTGREYSKHYQGYMVDAAEAIAVEIPKQAFAAPPAAWEQAWVNHAFTREPVDQCNFRRRRLYAYTIQPLLMLLELPLKLLALTLAILFGARDLRPTLLFNPFAHMGSFMEMFEDGTVFLGRGKSNFWNMIRLPFMPLIAVPLAMIVIKCAVHGVFAWLPFVLCTIAAIAASGWAIMLMIEKYLEMQEAADAWYTDPNEVNLVVCSGQQKPYSLSELPRHHRTLRLRFHALKSQICRPFAR